LSKLQENSTVRGKVSESVIFVMFFQTSVFFGRLWIRTKCRIRYEM